MTPKELFNANTKLVYYIFNKCFKDKTLACYHDDLIQEGLLALWQACLSYKPDYKTNLSTYAFPCIHGRMNRFYKEKTFVIRIPRYMWEDYDFSKLTTVSLNELVSDDGGDEFVDFLAGKEADYVEITELLLEEFLKTIKNKKHRDIVEEYFYGALFFESPSQVNLANKYKLAPNTVSLILKRYKKQFAKFMEDNL